MHCYHFLHTKIFKTLLSRYWNEDLPFENYKSQEEALRNTRQLKQWNSENLKWRIVLWGQSVVLDITQSSCWLCRLLGIHGKVNYRFNCKFVPKYFFNWPILHIGPYSVWLSRIFWKTTARSKNVLQNESHIYACLSEKWKLNAKIELVFVFLRLLFMIKKPRLARTVI